MHVKHTKVHILMGYLPMSRSAFKVKDKIYKILQLIVPVTF